MPKKRANGEGSIRKRKDGRWEGRYTAGNDPTTGKPIHKSVLAKTQSEAKEKLKQAIAEAEKLDMSRAKSYTLGAWIKLWYEVYAEPRLREKTKHYYLNYIDNHIIPELGNTPLEKLTTIQIQKFYNDLQKSGRIQRYTHIKLKQGSQHPRGTGHPHAAEQLSGAGGGGAAAPRQPRQGLPPAEAGKAGDEDTAGGQDRPVPGRSRTARTAGGFLSGADHRSAPGRAPRPAVDGLGCGEHDHLCQQAGKPSQR